MKGNKLMPQCGFSNNVVQILNSLGMSFDTFDVLEAWDMLRSLLETICLIFTRYALVAKALGLGSGLDLGSGTRAGAWAWTQEPCLDSFEGWWHLALLMSK